jgi:hypothetical protein
MKNLTTVTTLTLVSTSLLLATAASALAEPSDAAPRGVPAPSNALELTLGTTYSRGTGDLGDGLPSVEDVAGPGNGMKASIGWRATPNFLIGGYVGVTGFGDSNSWSKNAAAASAGFKADWHFQPAASFDPWVSVGTGVKVLQIDMTDNTRTLTLTGLELASVELGVDYRVTPRFAIGPVIGASATMFDHKYYDKMTDEAVALDDKKVNWTFTLGLLGRFDVFGTTR